MSVGSTIKHPSVLEYSFRVPPTQEIVPACGSGCLLLSACSTTLKAMISSHSMVEVANYPLFRPGFHPSGSFFFAHPALNIK